MSHIIYRCQIPSPGITTDLQKLHNTVRPPGNVPYIIDNFWEWKRPDSFPDRRHAVFASPTPELAQQCGPINGQVYRVEFVGDFKLVQLLEFEDSKLHPNVESLRRDLFNLLGYGWLSCPINVKVEIGRLWLPCLTKNEVAELFESVPCLNKIRDSMSDSINYWNEVVSVGRDDPFVQ